MNCKPGDMAVWVGSARTFPTNPNLGRVVKIGVFLGKVKGRAGKDRWALAEGTIVATTGLLAGIEHATARDSSLRPLPPVDPLEVIDLYASTPRVVSPEPEERSYA